MTESTIEQLLLEHPNVTEACVIAAAANGSTNSARAFVLLRDTDDALVESFCTWCRSNTADALKGVEIHVLSTLPRNRVGAVPRRKLIAVVEANEAWIAPAIGDTPQAKHVEPWVRLLPSEDT